MQLVEEKVTVKSVFGTARPLGQMYIQIIHVLQVITHAPDVDKAHYIDMVQGLGSVIRHEGA